MELAIIILNWNAAEDTIRCVRAVSAWQRLHPVVWVVDNGSSDESAEHIARACPNVHLIRNSTNLGFAGGNNVGISQALAVGEAPILLLNNDAFIEETDVIRLLTTLHADEHIGFVGPLLYDAATPDRLLSAGGKSPLRHHSHIYDLPVDGPVRTVVYVPGTVILGKAQVFGGVGLLDENYFFSTEVADLCVRARRQGYLSLIDARARATHALHRSSHLRDTLYVYYIIRNRFLFIRKFYRYARLPLYIVWALYSLAVAMRVWLKGKADMARAVLVGLWDGLRGQFGGQNERVLSLCAGIRGETQG